MEKMLELSRYAQFVQEVIAVVNKLPRSFPRHRVRKLVEMRPFFASDPIVLRILDCLEETERAFNVTRDVDVINARIREVSNLIREVGPDGN